MVFQSYALYPHMSVYQNMAFGLENSKMLFFFRNFSDFVVRGSNLVGRTSSSMGRDSIYVGRNSSSGGS